MTGTLHMLHIEDSEDYRALLATTLRLEPTLPFLLDSVGTLHEGLDKLNADDFDIVLLDWTLPDAKGEESIRLIRALRPLLSIVVFTGHEEDEVIEAAKQAGADAFLLKTASIKTILVSLHFATTQGRSRKELKQFIEAMVKRLEAVTDGLTKIQRAKETL